MPQEQQPTDTSNRKEGDADKRTLLTVFARLVLPESLRNMFGMSNYGRNFPLHRAVERRDVERVRRLLQGGIKPDVRDNHQVTALMLAAERGYDEIVEVLIKAGANVNAKNRPSAFEEGRRSALHRACEAGKVSTVKLLLELGADSNCLSQSQWSPLYVALFWRKPEVAICLLEHGANPNGPEKSLEPPLVTAASNNDLRMLKELLQRGADPNCGALAATTSVECVRELLQHGADINFKNAGDPPLLSRIISGNLNLLKSYLEAGADVNAKDKDGLTALERAGLFGPRIEVAELLVSAGANVNMLVSPDKTLIDWLSSLGRDNFHKQRNALVEFLRSKGAKSAKELIGQGQKLESRADAMQTKRPTQETTDREDGQFAELWRAGTDGANYELGTEDIVKRLKAWRRLCSFRIVDAKHDLVILEFETLPKDLDAFASDIYDFCPDVVDQGTVLAADVLETDLDGLEFLKRQLQEKRRLTLWWD